MLCVRIPGLLMIGSGIIYLPIFWWIIVNWYGWLCLFKGLLLFNHTKREKHGWDDGENSWDWWKTTSYGYCHCAIPWKSWLIIITHQLVISHNYITKEWNQPLGFSGYFLKTIHVITRTLICSTFLGHHPQMEHSQVEPAIAQVRFRTNAIDATWIVQKFSGELKAQHIYMHVSCFIHDIYIDIYMCGCYCSCCKKCFMRLNPQKFLLVEIETGTKFCLVGGDWNMNFLWLMMVSNG